MATTSATHRTFFRRRPSQVRVRVRAEPTGSRGGRGREALPQHGGSRGEVKPGLTRSPTSTVSPSTVEQQAATSSGAVPDVGRVDPLPARTPRHHGAAERSRAPSDVAQDQRSSDWFSSQLATVGTFEATSWQPRPEVSCRLQALRDLPV